MCVSYFLHIIYIYIYSSIHHLFIFFKIPALLGAAQGRERLGEGHNYTCGGQQAHICLRVWFRLRLYERCLRFGQRSGRRSRAWHYGTLARHRILLHHISCHHVVLHFVTYILGRHLLLRAGQKKLGTHYLGSRDAPVRLLYDLAQSLSGIRSQSFVSVHSINDNDRTRV